MASSGGLPDSGVQSMSLMSPALAIGFFITSPTWKAQNKHFSLKKKKISIYLMNPVLPLNGFATCGKPYINHSKLIFL